MIESFSHLIVFNYKVMCTIKYIGNQFGTGRTDRGGYRSPSAGTSDLKMINCRGGDVIRIFKNQMAVEFLWEFLKNFDF